MADYQDTIDRIFDSVQDEKLQFLRNGRKNAQLIVPAAPFANTNHKHAAIVISKLVTTTVQELVILSRKLSSKGHSALRLQAHLRRHPKARIRILVEGVEDVDDDGVRRMAIKPDGSIDWKELRDSALRDLVFDSEIMPTNILAHDGEASEGRIAVRVLSKSSPSHFMVSDWFSYRIEPEPDHLQGKAVVYAKDVANAIKLTGDFDELWDYSTPAHLSQFSLAA
jgi:hypothetical protein